MSKLGALWIGPQLGNLEKLCAKSFVDKGNELVIYSYEEVGGIPDGVENRDARELLNTSRILRHGGPKGSPAIHSDLFRFAMLNKTDRVWVDLDMLAVRNFEFSSPYIFGYEMGRQINCAVLGLPHESPALAELSKFNENSFGFPKAGNLKRRLEWLWEMRFTPKPIEYWPWGCAGPRAVTHYLRRTGEEKHALPAAAFYPVAWQDVEDLVRPGAMKLDDFGAETFGIHLWASSLKHRVENNFEGVVPEASLLGEMLRQYDLPLKL